MPSEFKPRINLHIDYLGNTFYEEMLMAFADGYWRTFSREIEKYKSLYTRRQFITGVLCAMAIMRDDFQNKYTTVRECIGVSNLGWLTPDRVVQLLDQISASEAFRGHVINVISYLDRIDLDHSAVTFEQVKKIKAMLMRAKLICKKFEGKDPDLLGEMEIIWS